MARKQMAEKPSLEQMIGLLRNRHPSRLAPPLEGLAYRFSIWLPILAQGMPVFSEQQRLLLYDLFHDCFGGFSQSTIAGFPPWSGSWLPKGTNKPIIDHHVLFIIYALQDAAASVFFRQLKWILQQPQVAGQEVVLIEQMPVHLVEAAEIT